MFCSWNALLIYWRCCMVNFNLLVFNIGLFECWNHNSSFGTLWITWMLILCDVFVVSRNEVWTSSSGTSSGNLVCTLPWVSVLISVHFWFWACSARSPSGNQVDGLPLAASNATQEEGRAVWTKHIYGNGALQMRCAQDPIIRSQPKFQGTQKRYRGNFLYRWHVCYYHRCGARAKGLCCWVMKISHFQHKTHTGTRETH